MLSIHSFRREAGSLNPIQSNPPTLLLIIAVAIFCLEVSEPLLFDLLPSMPRSVESLVDGMLMFSVLSVLLYLFLMRPMVAQITSRERVEEELRKVNEQLETLVEERTMQLCSVNEELVRAIDDQRAIGESLRRNNAFVESVFNRAGCLLLAFDVETRRCIYVNNRITDLLNYEQDDFVAISGDLARTLVANRDRHRFLKEVTDFSNRPPGHVTWSSFNFVAKTEEPVSLVVGFSALEEAPMGYAKSLLMTAVPTVI
jgi:PAS domain-containing protein